MTTSPSALRDDPGLVADAQAGDPEAMARLLAELRPVVFRYCRSKLATYAGGVDAAEDVAQETCLAILKVLPSYQRRGVPFHAWVYGIAAKKIADAQRGFGRSAVLVEDFPDGVEPSPTPEDYVTLAAGRQVMAALVDRLPPRMRDVVLLRADGMTAEAVGQFIGLSAGGVRVLHHRALAKLRQIIQESEEHREMFDTSLSRFTAKRAPEPPGRAAAVHGPVHEPALLSA